LLESKLTRPSNFLIDNINETLRHASLNLTAHWGTFMIEKGEILGSYWSESDHINSEIFLALIDYDCSHL